MTKILRIEDFINESKGTPLYQRTPDRFNGDVLNKNNEKYLKMLDKFYLEDIFNMPNSFASKNVFQCYGDYNGKDYGVIVKINKNAPYKPIESSINDPGNGYLYSFDIFGVAMTDERRFGLLDSQKNALKHVFGIDATSVLDETTMLDKGLDVIEGKNYVYLPISYDGNYFYDMFLEKEFENKYVSVFINAVFNKGMGFDLYLNTIENENLPDWDGWDGERTTFGITNEWKDATNSCLSEATSYISETLNNKLVEILG